MRQFFIILFACCCMVSCDPGYSVVLSNNSLSNKNVTVIEAGKYPRRIKDSIIVADTLKDFYNSGNASAKIACLKDTAQKLYSFTLPKGKKALVQNGIGFPNMSEKIVIENTDTILIQKKDSRVKIKKWFLSRTIKIKVQ